MNRKDTSIPPPPPPPVRKFVGGICGYETQQSVMDRLAWIKASKEWNEKYGNHQ